MRFVSTDPLIIWSQHDNLGSPTYTDSYQIKTPRHTFDLLLTLKFMCWFIIATFKTHFSLKVQYVRI